MHKDQFLAMPNRGLGLDLGGGSGGGPGPSFSIACITGSPAESVYVDIPFAVFPSTDPFTCTFQFRSQNATPDQWVFMAGSSGDDKRLQLAQQSTDELSMFVGSGGLGLKVPMPVDQWFTVTIKRSGTDNFTLGAYGATASTQGSGNQVTQNGSIFLAASPSGAYNSAPGFFNDGRIFGFRLTNDATGELTEIPFDDGAGRDLAVINRNTPGTLSNAVVNGTTEDIWGNSYAPSTFGFGATVTGFSTVGNIDFCQGMTTDGSSYWMHGSQQIAKFSRAGALEDSNTDAYAGFSWGGMWKVGNLIYMVRYVEPPYGPGEGNTLWTIPADNLSAGATLVATLDDPSIDDGMNGLMQLENGNWLTGHSTYGVNIGQQNRLYEFDSSFNYLRTIPIDMVDEVGVQALSRGPDGSIYIMGHDMDTGGKGTTKFYRGIWDNLQNLNIVFEATDAERYGSFCLDSTRPWEIALGPRYPDEFVIKAFLS